MTFIPLNGIGTTKDNLKSGREGTVIDNSSDPLEIGRIKVAIDGIYSKNDIEALPYVCRAGSSFLGGSTKSQSFSVPELGSKVWVTWPYGDKNFPFYGAAPTTTSTKTNKFSEHYPLTYGFTDSSGLSVIIDKLFGIVKAGYEGRSQVTCKSLGETEIVGSTGVTITSPHVTITEDLTVGNGKSGSYQAGKNTLIFKDGILVDVL